MIRNVKFFSNSTTYAELQDVLFDYPKLKAFPIVENEGFLFFIFKKKFNFSKIYFFGKISLIFWTPYYFINANLKKCFY
jgi:hypothetical protein